MGTWGVGNFDNDAALDFVAELAEQLQNTIKSYLNSSESILEDGEERVIPSVSILILLTDHCGAISPSSEDINSWRDKYLQIYDRQIDSYDPTLDFKSQRRKQIEVTFGELLKKAESSE